MGSPWGGCTSKQKAVPPPPPPDRSSLWETWERLKRNLKKDKKMRNTQSVNVTQMQMPPSAVPLPASRWQRHHSEFVCVRRAVCDCFIQSIQRYKGVCWYLCPNLQIENRHCYCPKLSQTGLWPPLLERNLREFIFLS